MLRARKRVFRGQKLRKAATAFAVARKLRLIACARGRKLGLEGGKLRARGGGAGAAAKRSAAAGSRPRSASPKPKTGCLA